MMKSMSVRATLKTCVTLDQLGDTRVDSGAGSVPISNFSSFEAVKKTGHLATHRHVCR